MKPDLIRHLQGESIGRFPVWAMRQAGRYLPQYRAIRARHSFWEMVTLPEVAVEVSLTPVGTLPVDGIIFFSDILTLPHGLGVPVEMREGVGPVNTRPMRSVSDFGVFNDYDPQRHTPYISTALSTLRKQIPAEVALLGFAGAPWTVASYLAEGESSKKHSAVRNWMHRDPKGLAEAMGSLTEATIAYLGSQIDAGVDAVQVFDTWLSEMPRSFFNEHYVPLLNRIFEGLEKYNVPVIFFSKRAHHLLEDFAQLKADVLSVDELLTLPEVERRTGGKFHLQGNLDPILLFGETGDVRRETRALVAAARTLSRPAILNLGHGILPGTPVENVKAFFEEARALWV